MQLKYAVLHFPIFVPGAANLGPTLTLDPSSSKVDNMTLDTSTGFVTIKLKDTVGKGIEILAPVTSFTHMVLAR